MYTYDQVFEATTAYFGGNELATNVWMSKYALKSGDNFLELTPDNMHHRLAEEFARIEQAFGECPPALRNYLSAYGKTRTPLTERSIYRLFQNFENVIPQGSVMAVLGDENYVGSLSNCVVVPNPHDSYGGILYTDQQLVQLMKRRCGVGTNISGLRPEGMAVTNAARTSTGAVSFMQRFSSTTREVAQSGRRGALMLTMDCRHPDILTFINVKRDLTQVTGANISVMWTDDFMAAVENDTAYTLRWPVTSALEDAQFTKEVRALDIWNAAVESAYTSAEPGMIFMGAMTDYSTCEPYMPITSTNPCSEIGMGNDSCRLIAINMFGSVVQPYTPDAWFNHEHWYRVCYEAMRLGDDLVELELEHVRRILAKIDADPEPEHIKSVERQTWQALYKAGETGRRVGVGFTALGDTVAALGYKYGNAQDIIDGIVSTKFIAEWDATIDMAISRGPMPLWNTAGFRPTTFTDFLARSRPKAYQRMLSFGRRNISLSTVAPTGSLSLLAKLVTEHGTTSGIEPLFAPWYTRRKKVNPNESDRIDFVDETGDSWTNYTVHHAGLLEWAKANDIKDIATAYPESPYYESCAPDLDWTKRVELQALIQRYVTHSISSTVNLPSTAISADVGTIYRKAHSAGLKGITVYVDGSRTGVLVTDKPQVKITKLDAPKRPKRLPCVVFNTSVRGEYWVVLIGLLAGEPYELFAYPNGRVGYTEGILVKVGRGHYDLEVDGKVVQPNVAAASLNDEQAALTRIISAALRHGADVGFVVEQLDKAGGTVVDFSKAVARALKKGLGVTGRTESEKCPECGNELTFEDGCKICKACGVYSKCD